MNYFASYRLTLSTVKTIRCILCLATLLSFSPLVSAQTEEEVDSAIVEAPPVVEFSDDNGVKIGTVEEQTPAFRQVPDSIVKGMQSRKEFGYANDPGFWQREPEPEIQATPKKGFWDYFYEFFSVKVIRQFAYGILIVFFAFVIYRIIVVNKLFLFYSSKKGKNLATGEEADIKDINLDEKIKLALTAKDHRMAVRYMYLKALQLLNEKQWIRYHADGTNYEYVHQMSGRKLANEFGFLTRVYDYVWYGEFTVTAEQFDIVYKNFSHFYNAVKS